MIVYLNGEFVPEEQAVVSVFDRGFLYGDGLFETLRVHCGRPFRWRGHVERLRQGAAFLGIRVPLSEIELGQAAARLIEFNALPEALLRITLSRGVGLRGYSPRGADKPVLVMTLHPLTKTPDSRPPLWRAITASFRLPANEALARFKTGNKLAQVLAHAEADAAGCDEALLRNTDDEVVEGASANLFWVNAGVVCTPPLAAGILAGVTREAVIEICRAAGLVTRESAIRREELCRAEGVFLSLSSWGIVELTELDGEPLGRSTCATAIQAAYAAMLERECAVPALPAPE